MSGCHSPYYRGYYGLKDDTVPVRSLVEDLLIEGRKTMLDEMKEMEDRLKRHITESKRTIIKEIENIFIDKKSKLIKSTKKEG